MTVDTSDIERVAVALPEADPPRVADANTVLTNPFHAQFLQTRLWGDTQVVRRDRRLDLPQFAQHHEVQRARPAPDRLTVEQAIAIAVGEALDPCGQRRAAP